LRQQSSRFQLSGFKNVAADNYYLAVYMTWYGRHGCWQGLEAQGQRRGREVSPWEVLKDKN